VGVRVVKGDQTGYGYTEDLSLPAIKACAQTAAAIADGPSRAAPQRYHVAVRLPQRYAIRTRWDEVRPEQKLPVLDGVNARVFAADPRVKKVNVHFRDEAGAVLLADSDGRIVEDLQPMTLLYVSCVAEQGGRREQGGYNVAGRAGFEFYSPDRWRGPPSSSRRARRPPARCRWCSPPARRASSSTRPSATAWRPTSTGRTSPSTPTRSASPSRSRS
jgi:TldD protein